MKQLALALALAGTCALALPAPAAASMESPEAQMAASDAAAQARSDLLQAFGAISVEPGKYLWRDVPEDAGEGRVVISLSDQMAYLYRGETLMAVATISTGKPPKITPTGIFTVLEKKPMHRSRKYDNAPMPFMQRIDE